MSNIAVKWLEEGSRLFACRDSFGNMVLSGSWPREEPGWQEWLSLIHIYGYDINMSEFVLDGDDVYLINATNPSPLIGRDMMTPEQFNWACAEIADLVLRRAEEARPMELPVHLSGL